MRRRLSKPLVIVIAWAAIVLASLYVVYRLVDPLPPRHFAIAAGIAGTTYDEFARQYAGPFNGLSEFPAEQPNDLPLSPTAEAFYRSGSTFWQRYTSFWLTSLLNRIVFFVIPVVAMLIPVIGFAPRLFRSLFVRRIEKLHYALGNLERDLEHSSDTSRFGEYQTRIAEIESAVRSLKVARPFEVDLHRLRVHLRMFKKTLVEWERQIEWTVRCKKICRGTCFLRISLHGKMHLFTDAR